MYFSCTLMICLRVFSEDGFLSFVGFDVGILHSSHSHFCTMRTVESLKNRPLLFLGSPVILKEEFRFGVHFSLQIKMPNSWFGCHGVQMAKWTCWTTKKGWAQEASPLSLSTVMSRPGFSLQPGPTAVEAWLVAISLWTSRPGSAGCSGAVSFLLACLLYRPVGILQLGYTIDVIFCHSQCCVCSASCFLRLEFFFHNQQKYYHGCHQN